MKRPTRKQKAVLIVLIISILSIVIADLVLFHTSLKKDGVGRGFSRYWRTYEKKTPKEESTEFLPKLVDFEVGFLEAPLLMEEGFKLFDEEFYQGEEVDYIYKTGVVIDGLYFDESGDEVELNDYEVYFLFLNNCNRIRVLYSEERPVQFVIGNEWNHPACLSPVSFLEKSVLSLEDGKGVIYLHELEMEFIYVFDLYYNLLYDNLSDQGYSYYTQAYLDGYSEYLLEYLEDLEGLIQVDSYGEEVVYMQESDEYYNFVMFSPEGFPMAVGMDYDIFLSREGFFESQDNLLITLLDGTLVEHKYSTWNPDTLEKNPIDNASLETFVEVGYATDGSSLFVKKENNDLYLRNIYNNHYLAGEIYRINEIDEDSGDPFSFERFVEELPVIYWEAPFGKILRFVRYDFVNIDDFRTF